MATFKLWQVSLFYLLLIAALAYLGFKYGIKIGSKVGIVVGDALGSLIGAIVGVIISYYLFQYVRNKGMVSQY